MKLPFNIEKVSKFNLRATISAFVCGYLLYVLDFLQKLPSLNDQFDLIDQILLSLLASIYIVSFIIVIYAFIGVILSIFLLIVSALFLKENEYKLLYINLTAVSIYLIWWALSYLGLFKYAGFYI